MLQLDDSTKEGGVSITLDKAISKVAALPMPYAKRTLAGYKTDLSRAALFLDNPDLPLDGSQIVAYLEHLRTCGLKRSTVLRARASINWLHRMADLPAPTGATLDYYLKSLRQSIQPIDRARPLSVPELRQMAAIAGDGPRGQRDRCLVVLGFAACLRPSEIVALEVGDLSLVKQGYILTVQESKTNRFSDQVGMPYGTNPKTCPVRQTMALLELLEQDGHTTGPIFRGIRYGDWLPNALDVRNVSRRVRRLAQRAGLDLLRLSGHSLRAGFITASTSAGHTAQVIKAHSRHTTIDMVDLYYRPSGPFEDHPAVGIGL